MSKRNEKSVIPMRIEIPEVKRGTLTVEIVGVTALLTNKIADWVPEDLEAKQEGRTVAKVKHTAAECFRAAQHVIAPGVCGHPAVAFKQAMIDASSLVSRDGKRWLALGRAFSVRGSAGALCAILDKNGKPLTPTMSSAVARNKNTDGLCVVHRPLFAAGWRIFLTIDYDAGSVTAQALLSLLARVGLAVGVGSWSPAKNGIHGTFKIGKVEIQGEEAKKGRRLAEAA